MEQNRELRDEPTHLQVVDFPQRCHEHTMEKEVSSVKDIKKTGYQLAK
jgi:hypothetical protein